jgi:UDP-N-acetylmuramate dehydrogenase
MSLLDQFSEITQADQPLAPLAWMKVGGVAQYLVEPRTPDELQQVVEFCHSGEIPVHVLGGGSNVLIRDEGVSGAVIRLTSDEFAKISVDGTVVTAGSGALLSNVISESVKAELAGLDTLVGIPGTVGGALKGNAGGRSGDIGQFVSSVTVLTAKGERFVRKEDELSFAYRKSSINELVVLEAAFQLKEGSADEITQQMRKLWIMKKASQPLASQSAGCIFKNPRGLSAGALIDQSGLKGTRVGNAEISDRHANFIVTHDGATADEVLRLIDVVRSKVAEQFGVDLELEIQIW